MAKSRKQAKSKPATHATTTIDSGSLREVVTNRIVQRLTDDLSRGAGLASAGYTKSDGNNYGKYEKGDLQFVNQLINVTRTGGRVTRK